MKSVNNIFQEHDRATITEIAHRLYEHSLVTAYDGNISVRKKDCILITPTHLCKGDVRDEDLVVTNMEGRLIDGEKKPSSEIRMHLAIYLQDPSIDCVIHAHPLAATAVWRDGRLPDPSILLESELNLPEIGFVGPEQTGSQALAMAVARTVRSTNGACMIEKHGAVTWGKDPIETYYRMESLERLAQTSFILRCIAKN